LPLQEAKTQMEWTTLWQQPKLFLRAEVRGLPPVSWGQGAQANAAFDAF